MDLRVNIGGIELKNPVMVASGTFGYGQEYSSLVDLNKIGAIVVKGITLEPQKGNLPPRIVETPSGMLNSIGLQNVGVERFIKEKMPFLRRYQTAIIVNISGKTIEDYAKLAKLLSEVEGIAGLEINISCPNVKEGGMIFGSDPSLTYQLVKEVRKATFLPLIVKLSPNVTNIILIAQAAAKAKADALSLINTLLGMAIDAPTKKPKLTTVTGGLSGPAIKPIALRMVWEVYKKVALPIIGQGGITSATDAVEFIIAGAKAVAIGTANFVNPQISIEALEGIKEYLRLHKIESVSQLVGSLIV
ncbi:dihydroorotate dehydrogenase [bacterium]|nr:dihydroorotate dehydrogenase [bacterium]MBU1153660.1 dihydroorotate dehydrogenase [bacterium]MBU1782017.1 dihydroorotate dehydrogenase [bacterium]MBU2599069.1 dihydroorotate dehydrogenase [bacterium]